MSIHSRVLILFAWFFLIIASIYVIAQSRFSSDFSAFLPKQATAEDQLLVEQIKKGSALRTFLLSIEGGSLEQRIQASHELTKALSKTQDFLSVRNGNQQQSNEILAFIHQYRYLLSDRLDENSFGVTQLHHDIEDSIQRLTTDSDALLKPYFLADPTGETLHILRQLIGEGSIHQVGSAWASQDETQLLIVAESRASGSDLDGLEKDLKTINHLFQIVASNTIQDGLTLSIVGAPVSALKSRHLIKSEIEMLSIVSSMLIVALLLFFYRSFRLLLTGLLPVATGVIVATAVVGLSFDVVYTITLGFGIALIGEGVDYAIYYFMQSRHQQNSLSQQTIFWSTIRLGVLTSLAGFLTLLGSSFPGLVQISIFAMTGILVASLVTRFVLPIITSGIAPKYVRNIHYPLVWLIQHQHLFKYVIMFLLMIAFYVIFYHQNNLLNKNLNALNTASLSDRVVEKKIKTALPVPDMRFLWIVRADSQESVLKISEQLLRRIKQQDVGQCIASIQSPTHILPSINTQQSRLNYLPDQKMFVSVLDDALSGLPIKSSRLHSFTEALQRTKNMPFVSRDMISAAGLSFMVDSLLYQTDSEWVAILPVTYKSDDLFNAIDIDSIVSDVGREHVVYLDMLNKSNQLYQNYLYEIVVFSLVGLVVVVLLILISLRSVKRLYRVILPLIFSTILVVATLLMMGELISLFHIIGLLLVFAIGSNYSLFFESLTDDVLIQGNIMSSLILANLTTVIAFGTLAFSQVLVLHALGITVALGAFLSLVLSTLLSNGSIQRKLSYNVI
ncbi:MAG: MMPL family transporter [Thiotrichales bacterium]|jgi:predicted exporter|nr:MMPL family transporter [Thiotrichales bacterium]